MFQWNFQFALHVIRDFHFNHLAFNSTLTPKKNMQLRANLDLKEQNRAK
jgi:hypothetical protein